MHRFVRSKGDPKGARMAPKGGKWSREGPEGGAMRPRRPLKGDQRGAMEPKRVTKGGQVGLNRDHEGPQGKQTGAKRAPIGYHRSQERPKGGAGVPEGPRVPQSEVDDSYTVSAGPEGRLRGEKLQKP